MIRYDENLQHCLVTKDELTISTGSGVKTRREKGGRNGQQGLGMTHPQLTINCVGTEAAGKCVLITGSASDP
ncbi:hypothetical protein J6590_039514 [Homalodisca vitripennis]|nr:hypothetical protein J6590_039514 [Homalodisca vitripennis]